LIKLPLDANRQFQFNTVNTALDFEKKENYMNRRTFLKAVPALGVLGVTNLSFSKDANDVNTMADVNKPMTPAEPVGEPIKLNPPELSKGVSLMQALKQRKTNRSISNKSLTPQQLSDLLWSADGVNRPDNKRTSPAAMGVYNTDIYVVLAEGVYLYEPVKQELKPVAKGDFRKSAGMQDFVFSAPVNLVYVYNPKDSKNPRAQQISQEKRLVWIDVEVGCMVQNVYLYCASEGLATVVRGMIDQKKFGELVKVKPEQVIIAQTVGFPK
jgi:SagB-type dehydrogenase family enzyme